jgi:hypothetical protein
MATESAQHIGIDGGVPLKTIDWVGAGDDLAEVFEERPRTQRVQLVGQAAKARKRDRLASGIELIYGHGVIETVAREWHPGEWDKDQGVAPGRPAGGVLL